MNRDCFLALALAALSTIVALIAAVLLIEVVIGLLR
jgi:hypothetical protein